MFRKHFVVVFLLSLVAAIAGWLAMQSTSSLESELAQIEALPATIKFSKEQDKKMHGATLIRLAPVNGNIHRDFRPLMARKILQSLKGFDATDCHDFGDQELSYLRPANCLEYLGLDGTQITDVSLGLIKDQFPSLRFLDIEGCVVTQAAILNLLESKDLVFIEISKELDNGDFRDQVRKFAPDLIVMCGGQDIMGQPESMFDRIPWDKWE